MKILVIGKPTYNIILPLANYLVEGTKYNSTNKLEMSGGDAFTAAYLLTKWKTPVSFTGVVGGDTYGNKIKSDLESIGIRTNFVEINYEHPTSVNYILINNTNGSSTQILIDNPEVNLTKYKYDFIPDYIIMDGTDPSGSIAALNNFPNATSILLANKVSNTIYDISKRSNYVIASTGYAKALTKMDFDVSKPKSVINFMQKIKDLNKAKYIITLQDKGVLYVSENQVKMIPALSINKVIDDTHAGSMFFGAFCYGLTNNYSMDDSVKIANITAGLSLTKLGNINAVPDIKEVFDLAGLNKPATMIDQNNPEAEPITPEENTEVVEETNIPNIQEEEVPSVSPTYES